MKESTLRKKNSIEVRGDFEALLARDSSQSPPPRSLPPLSALRKSSSAKLQASADSAASFATVASAEHEEEDPAASAGLASNTDGAGAEPPELLAREASAHAASAHAGQANGSADAAGQSCATCATTHPLQSAQQNGAGPMMAHVGAADDSTAAVEAELLMNGSSAKDVLAAPQQLTAVGRASRDASYSRAAADGSAAGGADVTMRAQRAQQPANVPSNNVPQEHADPLRATTAANAPTAGPSQEPRHRPTDKPDLTDAGRMAGLSLDDDEPSLQSPAAGSIPGEQQHATSGSGADADSEASSGEHATAEVAHRADQQRGAEASGEDASGGHAEELAPRAGPHPWGVEISSEEASGGHATELAPVAIQQRGAEASGELPVSTLRLGRCFSGYVSAQEDLAEDSSSFPDDEAASMELLGPAFDDAEAPGRPPDLAAALTRPTRAGEPGQQGDSGGSLPGSFSAWTGTTPQGAAAGASDEELQDLSLSAIRRAASCDAEALSSSGSQASDSGYELHALRQGDAHSAHNMQSSAPEAETDSVSSSAPALDTESTHKAAAPGDASSLSGTSEGLSDTAGPQGVPAAQGRSPGQAGVDTLVRAASRAEAAEPESAEDSTDWRAQRKHFFVLTNAGRPVFSAHGDINALAGFMPIIDALCSFAKDRGDALRSVRAGKHLLVFLERGPLYLVAVSAAGEPEAALALQLDLLHAHFLAILTDSFDRVLARNPRFEPQRLLGGTDVVLQRFLASFDTSPAAMLGGFEALRLPSPARHTALAALQTAVKAGGALYGVLLAGDRVVALAQPRAQPLAPADLLLLGSFLTGADSFRAAPESFSPICLPAHNPSAFLHAYVAYLDQDSGLCLAMLAQRQDAFFGLSEAAAVLRRELQTSGTAQAIARALTGPGGGRLRIADAPRSAGGGPPGGTPLQHFLYKAHARRQFVMPAWAAPLTLPSLQQGVMPAYARAHAAMFDGRSTGGLPVQHVHYVQDEARTLLAYSGAEYEVYAQFDALVDRAAALGVCQRLCGWIKGQHADLFVPLSF